MCEQRGAHNAHSLQADCSRSRGFLVLGQKYVCVACSHLNLLTDSSVISRSCFMASD